MKFKTGLYTLICIVLFTSILGGANILKLYGNSNSIGDKNIEVKGASIDVANASDNSDSSSLKVYPKIDKTLMPIIYAKEYILYHPESGKVIIKSQNMDPVSIASTTKLMSNYLAAKYGNPDDVITVSTEASSQIGSLMNLRKDEKLTLKDLQYGALLVSGNDAVMAISEYIGGILLNRPDADNATKTKRFVEEMNNTAKLLKMNDTEYKDPAGLNDEGHSTAYDLAKLSSVMLGNEYLKGIMTTEIITVTNQSGTIRHDLRNSNRFVTDYQYGGVLLGKTGNTPDAGHCLVVAIQKNGQTLIAVVLHTNEDSNDASAVEARKLMDFGFANLQTF